MGDVGEEFALDAVCLVECDVGFGHVSELFVEQSVGPFEVFLRVSESFEHGVEIVGELLEFVSGVEVGAGFEVAVGDAECDVPEFVDGSEDESFGNDVEDEDGEGGGEDACGDDDESVDEDSLPGGVCGDLDGDESGELVFLVWDGGFSLVVAIEAAAGDTDGVGILQPATIVASVDAVGEVAFGMFLEAGERIVDE